MVADPFQQWMGLVPGETAWMLAWAGVAVLLVVLGLVLSWLTGRVASKIPTEVAEGEGWTLKGHVVVPGGWNLGFRRGLVRSCQVIFVLAGVDLGLRITSTLVSESWFDRGLYRVEALVLSFLLLRLVWAVAGHVPTIEAHFKTLKGTLFNAWSWRDTQVLSAENVTGMVVAGLRLVRFALLLFASYWIAAFLWLSFQEAEDIRPTLQGLILAIVVWQVFIWFDRVFPFLDEVVESWKGSLLRSIPLRGHAFITESDTTGAIKAFLRFVRIMISASFLAALCIYVRGVFSDDGAWAGPIRGFQYTVVASGGLWFLLSGTFSLRGIVESRLPHWQGTLITAWTYQRTEVLSAARMTELLGLIARWASYLFAVFFGYIYTTYTLGLFETTAHWGDGLFDSIRNPVSGAFVGIWNYLPHLLTIAVVLFIASAISRAFRWFFVEIEKEQIRFGGFYPEWAIPTYQLVRMAIVVFTLIAIFPHLPGANTSQFKGISVFIGLIISLGGSNTVGHAVSGVMLTYMRPFLVGDRVRIGETEGRVVERTLLVTRVRTTKNVDITVPNGTVLGSHIVNYSAVAKEEGLVLHTSVTLGYDVPWRRIHEVMIGAAQATEGIEAEPPPFVLQTALDDYYVHYELNGYTHDPLSMPRIYSDLHARLQDDFARAGIEILSPVYEAARDGTPTTIPRPEEAEE